MTLIIILLGLALEYFLGSLDHLRNFTWFDRYCRWLELKVGSQALWDGAAGVLLTLLLPVLLLALAAYLLGEISVLLTFFLSIAVLVYSLGPDMNSLLGRYINAIETGDKAERAGIEQQLEHSDSTEQLDEREGLSLLLIRSHENLFGVLFWFVVLGMTGAFLFCLAVRLRQAFGDIHGGYAGAARDLYRIMIWPGARLQALGFALAGSLMDAMEGWRHVEGHSLDSSEQIIVGSGMGALQYDAAQDEEASPEQDEQYADCLRELQSLLNRTLIIWLIVLGLMTLGGYLI